MLRSRASAVAGSSPAACSRGPHARARRRGSTRRAATSPLELRRFRERWHPAAPREHPPTRAPFPRASRGAARDEYGARRARRPVRAPVVERALVRAARVGMRHTAHAPDRVPVLPPTGIARCERRRDSGRTVLADHREACRALARARGWRAPGSICPATPNRSRAWNSRAHRSRAAPRAAPERDPIPSTAAPPSSSRSRRRLTSVGENAASSRDHVLHGEPEVLHNFRTRCRCAEVIHANDGTLEPDVSLPSERRRRLHAHARSNRRRKHRLAVRAGLRLEQLPRRHRHHTAPNSLAAELRVRRERERYLGSRGYENELGLRTRLRIHEHVRAARGLARGRELRAIEHGKFLAREHQSHGPARVLHRDAPRLDGLGRIRWANHRHVGHSAQARELLHRLMRGAILAQRDAVVRPHVDHVRVTQRRQTNARPHVVGERQECCAEGNHAAVMRHPREDRRHRVLADAEVDVSTRVSPLAARSSLRGRSLPALRHARTLKVALLLHHRARGRIEIRRSAHEIRNRLGDHRDCFCAGISRRHLAVLRREHGELRIPVRRKLARHHAIEVTSEVAMLGAIRIHEPLPLGLQLLAARANLRELLLRFVGHEKLRILRPAVRSLRQPSLVLAKRLAMGLERVHLVRTAEADVRARQDQRGMSFVGVRRSERCVDGAYIHPVYLLYLPTTGGESRADIFRACDVRRSRQRDLIRVVEYDEPTEVQIAGERRRLCRHAFHQVAIAGDDVRVMVDDLVVRSVEGCGEPALRHRQAYGVTESLSEWTGGDLHSWSDAEFRVPRCLAPPLPEVLQIVDRETVTCEIQETVQQRAAVARGQYETIAIAPLWICRVVAHVARPENVRHWRSAHRQSRMTGVRTLHRIDAESADGVDADLIERSARRRHVALCSSVRLLLDTRSRRSFHDLSNDSVPSRCSCAASAASTMPARANSAITESASPPSTGITPFTRPWSAKLARVLSGIVLIVSGAASASMYIVSGAFGSFVPVLANSSRCVLAPAAARACQRDDASSFRYSRYARCATAMPSRFRSAGGTLFCTATSHRLTKSDATEWMRGSRPAAIRGSIPRM